VAQVLQSLASIMKVLVLIAVVLAAGCGHEVVYIAGTARIVDTPNNESVLKAVEEYRLAVERRDGDALMLMTHPQYWEASGTPSGGDDYGYEGLRNVLMTRLPRASDIRYSMRYVNVHQSCPKVLKAGCRASVDVLIDASFTIADPMGKPKRPDKRDQNELVLEWDGHRWLFISGM
jgi:hypothetical protein